MEAVTGMATISRPWPYVKIIVRVKVIQGRVNKYLSIFQYYVTYISVTRSPQGSAEDTILAAGDSCNDPPGVSGHCRAAMKR